MNPNKYKEYCLLGSHASVGMSKHKERALRKEIEDLRGENNFLRKLRKEYEIGSHASVGMPKHKERLFRKEIEGLRDENNILSKLRKEYEMKALEMEKEVLDGKIHTKDVEQQRNELEAVTKDLRDANERIAKLSAKLVLKEDVVKKVEEELAEAKNQLRLRTRSPSVMPKEERLAVVDNKMEVIILKNQLAAKTSGFERLEEHNKKLLEEDLVSKIKVKNLQAEVSILKQKKEFGVAKHLQNKLEEVELLRKKLKDKTTAANKTKSKLVKMTGRLISEAIRRELKAIRREQEAERLVAKVKLRNRVEQAKDSREVSTLAGGLLGREKTRNPGNSEGSALSSTLNMVKWGREDLRKTNNNSDEVGNPTCVHDCVFWCIYKVYESLKMVHT